ncbi:alkaline phosphatase family protein [Lysinibacillus sp. NPDC094403]|uniref:alkaline phosphatase family protein n=1 Tax=Lysinibacillus sp. NPDC094403 TaxID=3390581 RepID=UPI003CFD132E
MELLVIGIDAVSPNLVFENLDDYPNIRDLVSDGVSGEYNGYVYGYGSHDNWISMYTGVSPHTHKVIKGRYSVTEEYPMPKHYEKFSPLWKILNENGYKVGFWKGLATTPPVEIDGYMVSGEPLLEKVNELPDYASILPVVCSKDKFIKDDFFGDLTNFPSPKTPERFGETWGSIEENPEKLEELLIDGYFKEGLEYHKKTLEQAYINIERVYKKKEVDVFWFYNSVFDYVGHFQTHDKDGTLMRECIKHVDIFIGKMKNLMKPKNIIFLSDHGQKAIVDFFPNCSIDTRKRAFGLSDNCIFSKNHIVMKGRNPGLLTGLHSLKATAIFKGENIKKNESLAEMRTLDIYPTILDILGIEIPKEKEGYILPIVKNGNEKNISYKFPNEIKKRIVLLLQTCEVSVFNSFINEYSIKNRFNEIHVMILPEYKEVFKINKQVKKVLLLGEEINKNNYDEILIAYNDNQNKEKKILPIKMKDE